MIQFMAEVANHLIHYHIISDLHSFLTEIDNEMDAMQATILQLQQKVHILENK